jgi:plasmid stabilization system protein ParE
MTYRLDPAARDEYREAALYYLDVSPRIAAAFVDQIETGIALIRKNPATWRLVGDNGVRRYLVRQFPYGIYYTVE